LLWWNTGLPVLPLCARQSLLMLGGRGQSMTSFIAVMMT